MLLWFDLTPVNSLFTTQVIWGILWTGLAIITISILVLMQTRWGQARPMSKCVVLSLLAHLLLIAYAHTTHMFIPQPANHTKPFEFTLSSVEFSLKDPDLEEDDSEQTSKVSPWNQFTTTDVPSTEAAPLDRAELEQQEVKIENKIPQAKQLTEKLPQTKTPKEIQVADQLKTPGLDIKANIDQSLVAAKNIDKVDVQTTPPQPQPAQNNLIPQLAKANIAAKSFNLPKRLPTATPEYTKNDNSDIQTLTEKLKTDQSAAALAAEQDRLKEAENKLHELDNQNSITNSIAQNNNSNNQFVSQKIIPAVVPTENALLKQFSKGQIPLPDTNRITMTATPLPLSMQGRVAENQRSIIEAQGGNPKIEASIDAALLWLASNQHEDGRWDASDHGGGKELKHLGHDRYGAGANADSGITALAVLAFLAKGHTHLEGQYRTSVQHGLEYIVNHQAQSGSLAGEARLYAQMYCHGMALLALSEAYAMTRDERLRPFLDSAIAYTVAAQHPSSGGWRYQPGDLGDMSQFGWQVMALHSAKLAGIEVPERTKQLMARFLNDASSGEFGGLGSYRKGEKVSAPMTAEALVCRLFLQQYNEEQALNEAADYLSAHEPDGGKMNLYFWYYATLGMHQMQDDRWQSWSEKLQTRLMASQQLRGKNSGSWDPDTEWGNYGGRVYSTALATLSLEVYFRYLPLYKDADSPKKLPIATRNAIPIQISR